MKSIILAAVLAATSGAAFAKADCAKHAKSEWMPEAEARSKIEAQGY